MIKWIKDRIKYGVKGQQEIDALNDRLKALQKCSLLYGLSNTKIKLDKAEEAIKLYQQEKKTFLQELASILDNRTSDLSTVADKTCWTDSKWVILGYLDVNGLFTYGEMARMINVLYGSRHSSEAVRKQVYKIRKDKRQAYLSGLVGGSVYANQHEAKKGAYRSLETVKSKRDSVIRTLGS